uniref:F-box domain-containing protein n=1 Tax=Aegilops tauschii subsp. strangulata TaxID=200361 RepID=A0A453L628_AEGTS
LAGLKMETPNTCSFCSLFDSLMTDRGDGPIGSLPEHLLVEILTRLPTHEWVQISCVSKHWASMFRGEYLWQTAIARKWPSAGFRKRWPGPIPRGSARRRFQALYVSENLVPSGGEIDELVGHTYLYLKEQLERVAVPPSSILHGTIIDQFIACGRTGEKAHELASNIWIAVIDNLEENQQTFMLLKHLAQEGDVRTLLNMFVNSQSRKEKVYFLEKKYTYFHVQVEHPFLLMQVNTPNSGKKNSIDEIIWLHFHQCWINIHNICDYLYECFMFHLQFFLPFPYSRSYKVLWRVFDKLFTDFRDCFNGADYHEALAGAKSRFQPVPSSWLGH